MNTRKKIDWKLITACVGTFLSLLAMVISVHEISHESELMRIQNNKGVITQVQKSFEILSDKVNILEIQVAKIESRLRM